MDVLPREIEIQRVMNLVQGFGWEKVKEEVVGIKIQITIEKEIFSPEAVTSPRVPA